MFWVRWVIYCLPTPNQEPLAVIVKSPKDEQQKSQSWGIWKPGKKSGNCVSGHTWTIPVKSRQRAFKVLRKRMLVCREKCRTSSKKPGLCRPKTPNYSHRSKLWKPTRQPHRITPKTHKSLKISRSWNSLRINYSNRILDWKTPWPKLKVKSNTCRVTKPANTVLLWPASLAWIPWGITWRRGNFSVSHQPRATSFSWLQLTKKLEFQSLWHLRFVLLLNWTNNQSCQANNL